jgi:hypothetical protein
MSSVLFMTLAAFCVVSCMNIRLHRPPFAGLFASLVLWLCLTFASIASIVVGGNGDPEGSQAILVAMMTMVELFYDWARALLFWTVCAFLYDRMIAFHRHSNGQSSSVHWGWRAFAWTYSVLMFIFATCAGGTLSSFLGKAVNRFGFWSDSAEAALNLYVDFLLTFDAFLIASSLFILAYAIHLFRSMKCLGVSDPVRLLSHQRALFLIPCR